MSISVRDCLNLPSFHNCEILSGENELSNRVNNIAVLDIVNEGQADDVINQISDYEIYLTSFSGINDNIDLQCRIIEALAAKNNVSLILICMDSAIRKLHPYVVSTARNLSFPLIVIPKEQGNSQYYRIINQALSLMLEEQNYQNKSYKKIANKLSKIPENKRSFSKLLNLIGEEKKVNIILSDGSGLNKVQSFCSESESFDTYSIINIFSKNHMDKDSMVTSEYGNKKINYFYIKFSTYKLRHYSLYIADENRDILLNEAHEIAELVQLFVEIWNLSEDEIYSQSIINAIYNGDNEQIKLFSKEYNFNINKQGQLFLIHVNYADNYSTVQDKIKINEKIKDLAKSTNKYIFFNSYGDYVVLFMREITDSAVNSRLISVISDVLKDYKSSITMLNISICEFKEVLNIYDRVFNEMERIFPNTKLFTLTDLLFANNCKHILELNGFDRTIFNSILKKIQTFSDDDDMLITLGTFYLDTDCHINETADLLYIHRHTVRYRLRKVHMMLQIAPYSQSKFFMKLLMGYYRLLDE